MEEDQCYLQNDGQTVVTWPDKVDISLLCRICANSSEYLIPIFDGEGMENELELKIKKHLPIEISKEDQLPMSLCYQCASTLIAWHDLTLGCIDADRQLRFLIQNSCKEESNTHSKIEDDAEEESFRGASDIEIEFEEEVRTTPSTSTQDHLEHSNPLIKVKKKNVVKPTLVKQESEKKQNQLTEDETKENTSDKESLLKERNPSEHQLEKSSSTDKKIDSRKIVKRLRKKKLCVCVICGKQFNFTRNLKIHMCSHSDSRPYSCELCTATFKRKDHVRNHRRTMHEGKSFTRRPEYKPPKKTFLCNICGNVLSSKFALNDHLRRHNGETPFQCSSCGKGFAAKSTLWTHEKGQCVPYNLDSSVTNEKHICNICNEEFLTYIMLYKHKAKHKMAFVCDICGKCYGLKSQLKTHQVLHSEERPHKCEMCDKTFKTKTILLSHKRAHTGERPYPCPHCPWKCKKHADLVVHIRRHTGEKPYKCTICGRGFSQAGDMRKHTMTHNILKISVLESEIQ